jgi:feruloyl-CoA synthase
MPAPLIIDRIGEAAEQAPFAPILPGHSLTNAEAWAQSGAAASWLIAQGFGPGAKSLAVLAEDGPERAMLLLGALRAGAIVEVGSALRGALVFAGRQGRLVSVAGPRDIAFAALAGCSIDAAVAERRRHIDASTPAFLLGDVCQRHGDLVGVAHALTLVSDPPG